jgi:hypothetical protein
MSAMLTRHAPRSFFTSMAGWRADFEHGQLEPFARSGMERNSLIDRKPQKRGANRRQDMRRRAMSASNG